MFPALKLSIFFVKFFLKITKIIVFYPEGGVSPIQERQMTTQKGENVYVVAVKDNFDAAQSQVKELFNDPELRQELAYQKRQFSSANSMNIGRLIPQIVYYFFAYSQLLKTKVLKLIMPKELGFQSIN